MFYEQTVSQAQAGFPMRPLLTEEQKNLDKASLLFSAFKEIDETMPIQVAVTFLMVAMYAPCSLTDIHNMTGWSQSTLSRHLLDLGERNRHKQPGLKLVDVKRDPMELRKNIYTLTPKGQKLAHKVSALIRT